MSFALFLLYLVVVLVRPIEFLDLELGNARPIMWLWVASFMAALLRALAKGEAAAKPVHFSLLGLLLLTIVMSQVKLGWFGGAVSAALDFSTSAGLFALICLNVTTLRRLRITCAVVLGCVVMVAAMSMHAYYTGNRADRLVLSQWAGRNDVSEEVRSAAQNSIPAQDASGLILWRIRGLGFMSDPNDLAQALVMVLPLLWGLSRPGRWFVNLVFVWAPGALLAFAIYLTHSRGALLGVASLFFFGLRKRFGTLRTTMALLSIGVVANVSGLGGGRAFSSEEESAGDRIEAWYEGIQMLKANPLLGVGYGNFLDHHHLTAHNSFVLCFAELGMVGYFFWMGLIVLVYQGLNKVIVNGVADVEEYKLAVLLRSSLIGFLTCAWFLSRTYQPTLFILLGMATATWYVWAGRSAGNRKEEGARRRIEWGLATLAAIAVSILAVYGFIVFDRMLVK